MENSIIGINISVFDELILQFYQIKEDINNSFNKMNSLVDLLDMCYNTDAGKNLISKYHTFANNNYQTILDNFDSYIKDLKSVKENKTLFDQQLSTRIAELKSININ